MANNESIHALINKIEELQKQLNREMEQVQQNKLQRVKELALGIRRPFASSSPSLPLYKEPK